MHLFGLTLAQFGSLLAVSVAVVAALYALRLRRRTVVVSFAPLWHKVARDRTGTSLFERLRRLVSFLLQAAFVFLVILAIARPRLGGDAGRDRRFVIVIDASGSMQALGTGSFSEDKGTGTFSPRGEKEPVPGEKVPVPLSARTRLDEAKALAKALVGQLGETDSAMILCAALAPEPVTAFETDRKRLEGAIDGIRPVDGRSGLIEAVRLARRLVAGAPGGVFVFTDRPPEPDGIAPEVNWRQVGRPLDNVAITRFAARASLESPGEYELLFEVRNFGMKDASLRLRVEAVGDAGAMPPSGSPGTGAPSVLEDRPLHLVPGGRVSDVLRGVARDGLRLGARLTREDGSPWRDGLPLDDAAFAEVRSPRATKVLVVGEPDFFLDSALRSDPLVVAERVAPADYKGPGDARVVIFDSAGAGKEGTLPSTTGQSAIPTGASLREASPLLPPRAIYVHPKGPGSPFGSSGEIRDVFVDRFDEAHPVMRFVGTLADVNIAHSLALVAEKGDAVLASCAGVPVMLAREGEHGRLVAFGFDLKDSDLPLRVAFPKIVRNAVRWVSTGESPDAEALQKEGTLPSPNRRPDTRKSRSQREASPLFAGDERVSDLYASAPAGTRATELSLSSASVGWELWPWLAALALALTLCEWVSYHRRWTV